MQRAVNAPPSRAPEVQVLSPRPILFRQSVGSDASQWYWEERSATLRAGSILCGRGGTSRRAGPRSRRAQAHEGATPSARTNFSRRGWNSRHGGPKPRWTKSVRAGATPAVATILRPCLEQETERFQKPLRFTARGRASRPGRTNFSTGGGMDTRESQKLVSESSCRCESCPVDHFLDSCLRTIFCRVVQREPSVLYSESR